MASFGENLRQARQARNITLQEIAASTKISSRALQALEDEHFEQLPGGIFNKGFVRAYARCIGLDEEKTVAEYLAAAKVSPSEIDMEVMSTQVAAAAATREPWVPNAATVVGVLAVIVAIAMGALWLHEQRKETRGQAAPHQVENTAAGAASPAPSAQTAASAGTPDPASRSAANGAESNANPGAGKSSGQGPASPVASSVAPSAAASPAASSASSAASSPARSAATAATSSVTSSAGRTTAAKTPQSTGQGGNLAVGVSAPVAVASGTVAGRVKETAPVEVSISAKARVWISVSSDGNRVETLTLDPEKPETRSRSYSAKEKLLLVVGNPAGLSVTYNGKPAGVLGRSGERATITFTPEGIEKQ